MIDVVDPATRSRMMSRIGGKDTRGELAVRLALFKRGYRYQLHRRSLPGSPDLVFPRHHAVIFINGCFWHGHDCPLFKWPKTRTEFWNEKISSNIARDKRVKTALCGLGWRIAEVWECSLKGAQRLPAEVVVDRCDHWLKSTEIYLEIRGM